MRPAYEYGSEVRLIRNVRNDGTYPGKDTGELLIRRGAIGVVYDVGTYLQDQLIYRVHFLNESITVGCREEELILATDTWFPNMFEFNEKVICKKTLVVKGETIVTAGGIGSIAKVLREDHGRVVNYHVSFGDGRLFQVPEAALAQIDQAERVNMNDEPAREYLSGPAAG